MIIDPYELTAGKAVRLLPGAIGELVAAEIMAARDLYPILGTSSLGYRVMRQIQEMSEPDTQKVPQAIADWPCAVSRQQYRLDTPAL